jgi:hypothetical protein
MAEANGIKVARLEAAISPHRDGPAARILSYRPVRPTIDGTIETR